MSHQESGADEDSVEESQTTPPEQAEDRGKLRALEAVLFMAADPLPPEELAGILEINPKEAEALAQRLADEYAERGLQVTRIAGGYQVGTRPEYGPYVAKLHKPERFRLTRASLETLAIIAYRQPVTRPEIESIRGVNSDSAVDTLLQYELIREAGRKDAPGRPVLYRTTEQFLGQFGLNSIEDLPRLETIPVEAPQVVEPDHETEDDRAGETARYEETREPDTPPLEES